MRPGAAAAAMGAASWREAGHYSLYGRVVEWVGDVHRSIGVLQVRMRIESAADGAELAISGRVSPTPLNARYELIGLTVSERTRSSRITG